MISKQEKKKNAILNVLKDENAPVNSRRIARVLSAAGYDLCERTVRMYLAELDAKQLTCSCGRRGRSITEQGCNALRAQAITQNSGRFSDKIAQISYRMNFNLAECVGTIITNMSVVDPGNFFQKLPLIQQVFKKSYAIGDRVCLLQPGEEMSGTVIPSGQIGFCSICSITINGVMLKYGVPTASRFGGLLEIHHGKPRQFLEMIDYSRTTIDPIELFIRSGMTDYLGAIRTGNGRIGAGFNEYPADSRPEVMRIANNLSEAGMGAFLEIGFPGQPILGVPVGAGSIGAIVVGGLNLNSISEENSCFVKSRSLSGTMEYERLFPSCHLAALLGSG